jgi:hypothetical protein
MYVYLKVQQASKLDNPCMLQSSDRQMEPSIVGRSLFPRGIADESLQWFL